MGDISNHLVARIGIGFGGIGGAMMSTFAPSIVPDQMEPWVFATGFLIAIGSVLWPWISLILVRSGQWLSGFSLGARPRLPNWVPLARAVAYLAKDSKWANSQCQLNENEAEARLQDEFLERAAQGDLECRGIEYDSDWSNRRSNTSIPIEPEFFETAFFQPFGELLRSDGEPDRLRNVMATEGRFHVSQPKRFANVVVSRESLLRTWPPSRSGNRPNEMSVTVQNYMKRATENSDWEFDTWVELLTRQETAEGRWRPLN